jgi:hypothetical protein
MSEIINENSYFYTYPQNGVDASGNAKFDKSKFVLAKYLIVDGARVPDPNPSGSIGVHIYRRLSADGTVDESSRMFGAGNYLIVPANYDPSEAVAFAARVNADIKAVSKLSRHLGQAVGALVMTKNFRPGGGQDLQRSEKWGVPAGEVNPVFKDAASWNLGFITEQIAMPNEDAEIGGGALNRAEYKWELFKRWLDNKLGKAIPKVTHKRPDGPFGMSARDAKDFDAGVRSAEMAGFHKAVIDQVRPGIGSAAPITTWRSGGRTGRRRMGQQADAETFHAQVMAALPGVKLPAASPAGPWFAHGYDAARSVMPASAHFLARPSHGATGQAAAAAGRQTDVQTGWTREHGGFDAIMAPLVRRGRGETALAKLGRMSSSTLPGWQAHAGIRLPSAAPVRRKFSDDPGDAIRHGDAGDAGPAVFGHRQRGGETVVAAGMKSTDGAAPADSGGRSHHAAEGRVADQMLLQRGVMEWLDRQARLPPAGAAGFDPRLTPAWAGQKLPA